MGKALKERNHQMAKKEPFFDTLDRKLRAPLSKFASKAKQTRANVCTEIRQQISHQAHRAMMPLFLWASATFGYIPYTALTQK